MKKHIINTLVILGWTVCFAGCAGINKTDVKNSLAQISGQLNTIQGMDCSKPCDELKAYASQAQAAVDLLNASIK